MTNRDALDRFVADNFLGIGAVIIKSWDEKNQQMEVTDKKGDKLTFEIRDKRVFCIELNRYEATL